jgi:hypothetical protein
MINEPENVHERVQRLKGEYVSADETSSALKSATIFVVIKEQILMYTEQRSIVHWLNNIFSLHEALEDSMKGW